MKNKFWVAITFGGQIFMLINKTRQDNLSIIEAYLKPRGFQARPKVFIYIQKISHARIQDSRSR